MLRPRELKFISILLGLTGLLLLAGGLFNAYQSSLRPWLTGVPYENSGATLAAVRRRGHLRCGVEGSLRGFSVIEGTSIFEEHGRKFFADARGFDADFCRVIAVAVFGTTVDRVYFTPADVVERFDLVREGTVDVLIRNTTWTAMRDTLQGIDFGPVIFHDGQKFLVPADSGIEELVDLDGQTICVLPETTTLHNAAAVLDNLGIEYEFVVERRPGERFSDNEHVIEAYIRHKCEVMTSDESQLIARRFELDAPAAHRLIPNRAISYEPLAPVIAEGDNQWRNIISYAIWVTIYGEQLGISSQNSVSVQEEGNPIVRAFLGATDDEEGGQVGPALGLDANFARNIIEQVGNYAEIFERNLGPMIEERGPNQIWELDREGRLFSPPFSP